jgi:hypothetical protein
LAGYRYYLSRRIAVRRALPEVYYCYRLYDHAMSAVAEGIAGLFYPPKPATPDLFTGVAN